MALGLGGCGATRARLSEGDAGALDDFGGGAGGGSLVDAGSDGGSCGAGTLPAGLASDYDIGTVKTLANAVTAFGQQYDLFVTRDAGGLFAFDADCTHAGCPVTPASGGYFCACHGASFDDSGQHTSGPGSGYLQHYAVCVDASGNVTVDIKTTATPTQRF